MPPVIVAGAAALAYSGVAGLFASATLGAIIGGVAAWGAAVITNWGLRAIGLGPDVTSALDDPNIWLTNEPSNTAPIPVVYGQRRMGGTIVFAAVVPGHEEFLHVVYAICEGPIEEIGAVYLDNKPLSEPVADDVSVLSITGYCQDRLTISFRVAEDGPVSGSTTGTFAAVQAWAEGTYAGHLELELPIDYGDTFTVDASPYDSQDIEVTKVRASFGESWHRADVIEHPSAENDWTVTVRIINKSETGPPFFELDLLLDVLTAGESSYAGRIAIYRHLGADDQLADASLVQLVPEWTTEHRLRGVAYVYLRYVWDQDVFPSGLPTATFDIKGRTLYDPRDGETRWSDNPALAVRDYLTSARYGRGVPAAEVDDAAIIAGANYCDADIDGEGTRRWTCNGALTTGRTALDNMKHLLTSCRGWLVHSGGLYRLVMDAPAAPVFEFNEGNIKGAWTFGLGDKSSIANRVHGKFFDPEQDYQGDFAIADSPALRAQDRGLLLEQSLPLEMTNNRPEAYRHAAIALNQSRQNMTVAFAALPEAAVVMPGDVVTVVHSRPGWDGKLFRILHMSQRHGGDAGFILGEYADAVYDWGTIPDYDPAPNTNLPSPGVALPPTSLIVSEVLYLARASAGAKAKAIVRWTPPADPYVREYQLETQGPEDEDWQVQLRTPQAGAEVLDIVPGRWLFRVQAINSLGVRSEYSQIVVFDIQGLLAPPTAPTNLTLTCHSFLALLNWDPSPDLDVRAGGSFRVRHATVASPTWDDGYDMGIAVPGSATQVMLPLVAGTYLVKAVDSSGIESTTPATVETDAPGLWGLVTLDTWSAHTAWSGTHTGTEVNSGALRLEESGGAVQELTGSWESSGGLTLSVLSRVQLTAELQASAYNVQDLIDSRVDPIDTWPDFDGAVNGAARIDLFVSAYDDGAAAWGPWRRMAGAADFYSQQFKFKVVLTSLGEAYNVAITSLTVVAREVA